jgi:hypothetical protein
MPAVGAFLADHPLELCVLENHADVLFDQPQLLRFLPHLILISAKEAGRFRHLPTVGEFVRKVADVHLGPGLT